jgi:methyl-accepting chemotaxis protein
MLRLSNLRITGRLIIGFTALGIILAAAVGYTAIELRSVSQNVNRMATLRAPVAITSTELVGDVYSTLATLRGYLLTGKPQGKLDRAAMWKTMDTTIGKFDKMAERFTVPENKRKWQEAKVLFEEFRIAQAKAEKIAFTPDAYPANKILTTEAAPLVDVMFSEITKMINEEEGLDATADRKRLLKSMADLRGNLAAGAAQIRMYLLSGDKADRVKFEKPWGRFAKAFATLNGRQQLMTATQRASFGTLAKARAAFEPLPAKMFAIRESAQWNAPVYILTTEAAPRAGKILDILDGAKQADGTRQGGLKTSQQALLAQDSHDVLSGISNLTMIELILLAIGLGAAVVITFLSARAIATPISKIASVLVELTNDRVVDVPYTDRNDEVGEIAKATDVFKQSIAEKVVNLRVRSALDVVTSNVMVADADYNIIYMNQTQTAMMKEAEAELKKVLPNFDASKLIGSCMDIFHKNPAHQRKMLDQLTGSHQTEITVGTVKFHLVATPVIDAHGKRAGTVVEWQNVTELRKQEEAAFRVRSALDGCATNMMVADENYNIIYMNQTMLEMMRSNETKLRAVLPNLDSKKLIGSCIDVFHKNPAHQRGILEKLTGTLQTDLELAGLNFHLVVSPIVDKNGRRLGTTVEWKDETAEKAVEREIDGVVQAAAAGDFSQRIPTEGKKGFTLNLSNAMNGLCDTTGKALEDLASMMGSLATGDMTQRISAEYQGMFGKLKDDANKMADQIGTIVSEIKASAREVTNASAEISTSTTDLSQRTEEQAASLEETSASMEEISATVKKNAENAQQANQSAAGTRDVADRGGQVVAKAVDAMAKIEESSRKISDIIGVIDEIARQTNLLALNAAVEAARAGEAGRGFAVVASEVRSLAQRSSQAAKDIKDLITNSNGQVKDGVDLVNKAGTALTEIVESIKKVADIVSDITNASIEQSTGIEQVNKALTQMDEVTQQNSALVEENAATAKTLEHQAKAMDERVAFFKLDGAAEGEHTAQPADARKQRPVAAAPSRGPAAPKQQPVVAPKRAAAGANGGGPVGRMHATLATAVQNDPDWKEF